MAVPYFPTIKNDWRINNMLKIKTESNNYLAVSTCLEELQESAEAFTHAIDDWNDCMEILDRDTEVIYPDTVDMSGLVAVEE